MCFPSTFSENRQDMITLRNIMIETIKPMLIRNNDLVSPLILTTRQVNKTNMIINLSVPYESVKIKKINDLYSTFRMTDDVGLYKSIISIKIDYSSNHSKHSYLLSEQELVDTVNKLVTIFDAMFDYYKNYRLLMTNLNTLEIEISRNVNNVINSNNGNNGNKTFAQVNSTFSNNIDRNTNLIGFINYAYFSMKENVNNPEYYARLFTGLYCSHFFSKDNIISSDFPLHIIENNLKSTTDFTLSVNNIMSNHQEEMERWKESYYLNIEHFVKRLYYNVIIDPHTLKEIENSIARFYKYDINNIKCLETHDYPELNDNDYNKESATNLLEEIKRFKHLINNSNYYYFDMINCDMYYFERVLDYNVPNLFNRRLIVEWENAFTIPREKDHNINDLSNTIVDFLYSDNIIEYYASLNEFYRKKELSTSITNDFHILNIDFSTINKVEHDINGDMNFLTPFIISKASEYFDYNIDNRLLQEYYHYHISKHIRNNQDRDESITVLLFYSVLKFLDNEKSVKTFLNIHPALYDYYEQSDDPIEIRKKHIKEVLCLISRISPEHSIVLNSGNIRLDHFINIINM